jgi:hydrogenase assembly chaperone HypC/HupF
MCLSEVGRVMEVHAGGAAIVDVDGRERRVSLIALTFDGAAPKRGDWLLLHTGFAIEVLGEAEAHDLAALSREVRGVREP